MDFKIQNDNTRAFFAQDFTPMCNLISTIRKSLVDGSEIDIAGINLAGILDFNPNLTFMYITLFQCGLDPIRFGSKRATLAQTLDRCISAVRKNKNFEKFDVNDSSKCRIMIEYMISKRALSVKNIQQSKFNSSRFEIGIDGIEIKDNNKISYYYMPTDAVIQSHMGFKNAMNYLLKKTPLANESDNLTERFRLLKQKKDWEFYLFNTRAFVSYKDECVPLYRGNILYDGFSFDTLLSQFMSCSDWLIKYMEEDGRFLYYYDCATDTRVDHEHPTRREDNLYYNDLRHCGGVITLIKTYCHTGDKKYIEAAKKGIDFTVSIAKEHDVEGKKAYYIYYNRKCKLGGVGLALASMMFYRNATGEKCYDEYIIGLTRHLMSRLTPDGEFMGYYIHPGYQEGRPLLDMSEQERMETFSFYYPGEALLGLALFANYFDADDELKDYVVKKTRIAMDWIINERPKKYAHMFTALPSDAWLMQSIDEWTNYSGFTKQEDIDFVFNDAQAMLDRMYLKDDSPFIDFEGGYYYEYGDHYFPDGARSEGLISAYYLAKKNGNDEFAQRVLEGAKKAAASQFQLFNCEKSNYSHKNPEKSFGSIRFKATRQWVRVDSIQHVACFFIRLYWTTHPMKIKKV